MPENEAVIQITSDPTQPEHLSWPKVEPHEWKQYGYWARPFVNGVVCPNSPVNSERSVRTDVLRDIIINLKGEGDYEKYPERWVPGIKHRALPSRPTRWNLPIPGEPLPFPWEVQLNPLLQHLVFGPSPLSWHLGTDPFVLLAYGRCDGISYVKPADRAQPATWPFLTYMHFNAVLGDTAPRYPWPFTVHNPRGIKCGDILTTIYDEFQKPILEDERGSWPAMRVMAVEAAHKRRLELVEPPENTLLRCDFLGGVAWFRGIEPTPDGEGWMMSFGTH
ncbi:hypothetical protein B0H34DRAFT_520636 [Crassisporium funariophilum]|nr:hypothetical protein B0H34DRAFT_520636 [Crassisporium funariophilum]